MIKETENFESALKKLEETVEKLEEGTISLNEALTTFESGIHWSRECKKFLDNAGQRIETILKNENGEYERREFEPEKSNKPLNE